MLKPFKTFISETLKSSFDFEEVKSENKGGHIFIYKFKTGKEKLVEVGLYRLEKDRFEVDFQVDGNFELTGKGEQFKILSTVIKIIEKFIETKKPKIIQFSAKTNEPSRVELYRKLLSDPRLGFKDLFAKTIERKGTLFGGQIIFTNYINDVSSQETA